MNDDDHTQAAREAGLRGWKARVSHHPVQAGRFVAVLTSPDYNPAANTGVMAVASGRDQADAFCKALEDARGRLQ